MTSLGFFKQAFAILLLISAAKVGAATTADLERELAQNPDRLAVRETLGQAYAKQKDWKKTISTLSPFSAELTRKGLHALLLAYKETKNNSAEIQLRQSYLQRFPTDLDNLSQLARAFERDGKTVDAVKTWRQVITNNPDQPKPYEELYELFKRTKNNYESQGLLKELIQRFGKTPARMTEQCRLYIEGGFLEDATRACKEAISLDPKTPENHVYLSTSYTELSQKDMGRSILIKAAKQFPKSEFVQYTIGQAFLKEKNYETAARYFRLAVLADPQQSRSQLGLAKSAFEIGQYAESLRGYDSACRLDKKLPTEFRIAESQLRRKSEFKFAQEFAAKISQCH